MSAHPDRDSSTGPGVDPRPATDSERPRLFRLAAGLRSWTQAPSPRSARIGLVLALLLFVAAGIAAVADLPELPTLRPVPLALSVVVVIPAVLSINAAEFVLAARAVAQTVTRTAALRIALLSAAANLLPVPGATVVRTAAIARMGVSLGRATAAGSSVALARLSTTALAAGTLLVAVGDKALLGWLVLAGGAIGLAASYGLLLAIGTRRDIQRVAPLILLAEVGYVGITTFRLFLVFWGFGFEASVSQVVALTLAPPLANLVGFFPSGIGLRELVAAALAPMLGLAASVSVVVTAVDRVAGLLGMAAVAAVMAATGHRLQPPDLDNT